MFGSVKELIDSKITPPWRSVVTVPRCGLPSQLFFLGFRLRFLLNNSSTSFASVGKLNDQFWTRRPRRRPIFFILVEYRLKFRDFLVCLPLLELRVLADRICIWHEGSSKHTKRALYTRARQYSGLDSATPCSKRREYVIIYLSRKDD